MGRDTHTITGKKICVSVITGPVGDLPAQQTVRVRLGGVQAQPPK